MSTVTLRQKLEAIKLVNFKFASFQRHMSNPDETGKKFSYLEFTLQEPISRVYSSITLYDPTLGSAHESKDEVMSVKCKLDLIDANEKDFTFPEVDGVIDPANCQGSYSGDLFLDLSRAGDVWLTDTKFSSFKQDRFSNERKERLQKALAKK